ncbi:hypothetical protein CGRA01v4_12102 [Colletotrichum graminicola]|nr:hypothetical protein CGRA01v4_12102 [Colletotrichum graminicola]
MLGSVGCRRPTHRQRQLEGLPCMSTLVPTGARTTKSQGLPRCLSMSPALQLSLSLSPSPSPPPLPLTTPESAPKVGGPHPPCWALTAPRVATTDGSYPTPWLTVGGRSTGSLASDEDGGR